MKNLSKHAEWLSLIEISGPFLTVSMLDKAFPQGLEAMETPRRQKLRAAYEEWREAVDQEDRLLSELHREWVRLVLTEMLEYDQESLVHAGNWPDELPIVSSQEHAGTFNPDWIVRSPADGKPRLFIAVLPPDTDLESVQRGDGWPVSLQERMTLLCRAHGVRVGLLTDGERWMLVNAPVGSTSSQASWYARLWFQEPITLKAFQSLLGVRRCFGPAEDTLESLLDESLKHHEEVTDTLGEQVRRAVEVLVQCLDKADEDRNRELLRDVKPAELYEAGLTVMMRLVFVLCAEERGLLLLGDSIYDRCYAVSTLRGQLAEEADRHGPEVLDRRHDAWARLLAVFRAVFGGIEHESLRMPALGGSLFDPDRFPFLEGRAKGTRWRDISAAPLPIDNRTVLLLLNSLQILEQSGGALLLSYRALDVEQIGHVYEGLLEHTVCRLKKDTLGLIGAQKAKNPNIALAELESARLDGVESLISIVETTTSRSKSAISNALAKEVDDATFGKIVTVCGGDMELAARLKPFAHLLRTDAWGDFIVYRAHSFAVTLGADRRETGTHYTPKSLTESIVETTLEPVAYVGPAEGKPREEWQLKSSAELLELKICDPAMGSGAFLVQVCRWLSERLVEAWGKEAGQGRFITVDGVALESAGSAEPMPDSLDERLLIARRLVAEKCLYGVDLNPLAVELAKLSIWLVTLTKGRPFGFLDHNLRSGDSLLGLHNLEQLTKFSLHPEKKQTISIFASNIEAAVKDALTLRKKLRETPIRDIRDVQYMERLDHEARQKLEHIEHIADAIIGEALASGGNQRTLDNAMDNLSTWAAAYIEGDNETGRKIIAEARKSLSIDLPAGKPPRKPFHWALEFPEVFERGGFDGVVGNPPYHHGSRVSTVLGSSYLHFLLSTIHGTLGKGDLCTYFMRRSYLLCGNQGCFGLLVTNSISEGENLKASLIPITNVGGVIYSAQTDIRWPGSASVVVTYLNVTKAKYAGTYRLNGQSVSQISYRLTSDVLLEPHELKVNSECCYKGSELLGDFYLEEPEALNLIKEDSKYSDVIRPFLGGKNFTSYPNIKPDRWVIFFADMTLEEAEQDYPLAISILRKRFFEGEGTAPKRKKWWQFHRHRSDMYKGMENLNRVLMRPNTSNMSWFEFGESCWVISNTIVVILTDINENWGVLNSSFHEEHTVVYAGRMKTDLQYTPTTCFGYFPLPTQSESGHLHDISGEYQKIRMQTMNVRQVGLTDLYKSFHDANCTDEEIERLRGFHTKLDQAVAAAYCWDDLDLGHGFHETKQGIRFTISENARREVLQRLLKLNHERYEEEAAQELHDNSAKRTSSRTPQIKHTASVSPAQSSLNFEANPASSSNGSSPATTILDFLRDHDGWHSKSDILSATGNTDSQWNAAITELLVSRLDSSLL